jgi:hypothetical protein
MASMLVRLGYFTIGKSKRYSFVGPKKRHVIEGHQAMTSTENPRGL